MVYLNKTKTVFSHYENIKSTWQHDFVLELTAGIDEDFLDGDKENSMLYSEIVKKDQSMRIDGIFKKS